MAGLVQSLVYQAIAVPVHLVVGWLWQAHSLLHKSSQCILLWQCLSVQLVYPLLRSVGRNHYQRHVLIVSLSHSRCQVQQGSTRCNANHHWSVQHLSHTQCIESRTAFICHRIALDIRTLVQVVHDSRVATTRTNHCVSHSMSHQQAGQDIYVFLTAIHILIFSLFPFLLRSLATPAPRCCLSAVRLRHTGDTCRLQYSYTSAIHTDGCRPYSAAP